MQYACAILSSVACPAVLHFSTLSHKWHDFREKLFNIKCVFLFSLQSLFEKFLIPRRSERDMIINVCCYSCKISVILVGFYRIVNFLDTFSKNTQISNFMKICLVEAELFHADWRTDRQTDRYDEANSRFSHFCHSA